MILVKQHLLRIILIVLSTCSLFGCAHNSDSQANAIDKTHKAIPKQNDSGSINQLAKTEIDRLADLEIRQNTESLRTLMLKLYKRNPNELRKSGFATPEKMIDFLFDHAHDHHYQLSAVNNLKNADALFLAFKPQYKGDRILAFILGLETMLITAHGGIDDFYLTDSINPQHIYNVARNIEIAAWKLANAKDANGMLYIISNSLSEKETNLSMEREFGKMIGRTDLFATAAAEKSERTITRILQNIATAMFLPI